MLLDICTVLEQLYYNGKSFVLEQTHTNSGKLLFAIVNIVNINMQIMNIRMYIPII